MLAARYEPSSRILALLLPAAGPEGASKHAVAFLAFTPDFRQLQLTHELPVALQGDCSDGPEGALVYTGELPFVLLPAVADTDGAGMANKVSPQACTIRHTAAGLCCAGSFGSVTGPVRLASWPSFAILSVQVISASDPCVVGILDT